MVLGKAIRALGILLWVCGIGVSLSNILGMSPNFPLGGLLITGLGVGLHTWGGSRVRPEERNEGAEWDAGWFPPPDASGTETPISVLSEFEPEPDPAEDATATTWGGGRTSTWEFAEPKNPYRYRDDEHAKLILKWVGAFAVAFLIGGGYWLKHRTDMTREEFLTIHNQFVERQNIFVREVNRLESAANDPEKARATALSRMRASLGEPIVTLNQNLAELASASNKHRDAILALVDALERADPPHANPDGELIDLHSNSIEKSKEVFEEKSRILSQQVGNIVSRPGAGASSEFVEMEKRDRMRDMLIQSHNSYIAGVKELKASLVEFERADSKDSMLEFLAKAKKTVMGIEAGMSRAEAQTKAADPQDTSVEIDLRAPKFDPGLVYAILDYKEDFLRLIEELEKLVNADKSFDDDRIEELFDRAEIAAEKEGKEVERISKLLGGVRRDKQ